MTVLSCPPAVALPRRLVFLAQAVSHRRACARPRTPATPHCSPCWCTPACAAARRWPSSDRTSTWTRASCGCAGRSPASKAACWATAPKTAKSRRFVPISAPAERLLGGLRASQDEERRCAGSRWRETGFIFTTETGEPYDPRNALRALKVAATKVGLPHAGLHTLRHSAASVMLTKGVPLKVVSEILGHSTIAITGDVYGHVAPDVSRGAMDVLGAAFGE